MPYIGIQSAEERKKLEKLRRKRDREAMLAKGKQQRKKQVSDLDSVPEVSSVDETDMTHSYEDLESKSRTITEEVGHDIRTSEAYKRPGNISKNGEFLEISGIVD
jgi:hypothetical protein